MASKQARTNRRASPAHASRANGSTPARSRSKASKYEEELQIATSHRQLIDAEYAQLQQQRAQIDARLEELRMLAHRMLEREKVYRELRGEEPPLPPTVLMDAPPLSEAPTPEETPQQ